VTEGIAKTTELVRLKQWNGPQDSDSEVSHSALQLGMASLHEIYDQLHTMRGQMAAANVSADRQRGGVHWHAVYPGEWLVVHEDGRREVITDSECKKRFRVKG